MKTLEMNAAEAARKCEKLDEKVLELREITPKMAATMLLSNYDGNRKIKRPVVSGYAEDMKAGRWEATTNNVIQIGTDGKLYDGQHRLNAVILAGVSVPMYVNMGADPGEYMIYDNGTVRHEADVVNVANATMSQTISKFIVAVQQGCTPLRSALMNKTGSLTFSTRAQTRECMVENDEAIQELIKESRRISVAIGVGSMSVYAKALYLIKLLDDPDFVPEFVDQIAEPVPSDKTVAAMKVAILKKSMNPTVPNKKAKIDKEWLVGTVLQAYDAFIRGTGITRLTRQTYYVDQFDLKLREWRSARQKG